MWPKLCFDVFPRHVTPYQLRQTRAQMKYYATYKTTNMYFKNIYIFRSRHIHKND